MWLLYHILQPPVKRRAWLRYTVTAISLLAAFGLRALLDEWLQWHAPFALLLPAVLVSAWYGGLKAGLIATAMGGIAAVYVFMVPGGLAIRDVSDSVAFLLFILEGVLVSATCEVLHRAVDRARSAATDAARKFEIMANNAPVLIWSTDTAGRCVFVNRNWLTFTGRTWEEELNAGWLANLHPDDLPEYHRSYVQAQETQKPYQLEYRLRRADGTYRWLLEHAVPRYDPDGRFEGFIGSCSDVTDSRREREELAFVARLQRSLGASLDLDRVADTLAEAAVPRIADWFCLELVHDDGHLETLRVYHADAVRVTAILSWPPAENRVGPLGSASSVLETGEVQFTPRVDTAFLRAASGDEAHRLRLQALGLASHLVVPLRARGRIAGVLTLATAESGRTLGHEELALVQKISGIAGFALDNARLYRSTRLALESAEEARQQTATSELALGHQRMLLKTIIDAVPALVAYIGPDGRYRLHNEKYQEWLGLGVEDIEGKTVLELTNESLRDGVATHLSSALNGETVRYENPIQAGPLTRHMAATLRPDRDDAGRVCGVVFHAYDITDRKKAYAELAAARELLRCHAEELEARVRQRTATLRETNAELEAFTYSVSHDLRTPLQFVRSFAEAVVDDPANTLSPESEDYLRRILRAATRMDTIIQDLLGYSRLARSEMQLTSIPLGDMISDVATHHQAAIQRAGARVEVEPHLPAVRGDRTGLFQALSNLVSNALKFTVPGRAPVIRIRADETPERVRLWVEDNGIGIAPHHHEKIFKLFERLHGPTEYPGTGIGLSLVRKAVNRMGGTCGVESAPGAGSRFWLDFPKSDGTVVVSNAPAHASA